MQKTFPKYLRSREECHVHKPNPDTQKHTESGEKVQI